MPDFGDDFGDSLKRFSSMFLRELFHQWLRDSQRNGYQHETIGGDDFDVKLFDDDAQREIFEQKLREAGIEFTEKSVPAVRFNTKDRKAIEKIYQEVIKDIDTGTYTPNKKEAEFVASQPADAQTQYDLSRLADNGLLPKEALAALGRNYTMGDAMKMLDGHKEAKEQFLNERKYRDLRKEAAQETDDLAKSNPKGLDIEKAAAEADKGHDEQSKDVPGQEEPIADEDALQQQEAAKEAPAQAAEQGQVAREQAAEHATPEIAEPEPSGPGYDMNDLTKNDARAVQAHDGGDADHHTFAKEPLSKTEAAPKAPTAAPTQAPVQAAPAPAREARAAEPADSWKAHIDKSVENGFRDGMSITDFAIRLEKSGIGIQAARDGSLQYYLLDDPYRKLNSINTSAKLSFGDFRGKGTGNRADGKSLDKVNDDIDAAEKAIEAVRGVASPVAAVAHDVVGRGLPDAPTDPIR